MTTHSTEQLALFMNARDVRDYGTAAWADLDLAGQEAYLTDAAAFVSAMKALGWTPPAEPSDTQRPSPQVAMHIAGGVGTLCGVKHPSHVTDSTRYADCADCADCIAAAAAGAR
ncbi:hypothetical protein ABS642_00875 [Microbacterium sp. A8/3-1]|uniref:Uncharacterized protein n=1 Tax=Microbacterium sp. A8/3-1 TaxID=3160749 RepID=A0AAU7VX81_9MICO